MIERPYENLYCDECKHRYVLDNEDRCLKIKAFGCCKAMCAQVLLCNHFEKDENKNKLTK